MERLTNMQGIPIKCFDCSDQDKCDNWCSVYGECAERLMKYENMHKKLEDKIKKTKESTEYPHNFTAQMIEDFEWVLNQIEK